MALAHTTLAMLLDCLQSIRKRFEGSVGFFWQASFQQIYRELGKLEEKVLVLSKAIGPTALDNNAPLQFIASLPRARSRKKLLNSINKNET